MLETLLTLLIFLIILSVAVLSLYYMIRGNPGTLSLIVLSVFIALPFCVNIGVVGYNKYGDAVKTLNGYHSDYIACLDPTYRQNMVGPAHGNRCKLAEENHGRSVFLVTMMLMKEHGWIAAALNTNIGTMLLSIGGGPVGAFFFIICMATVVAASITCCCVGNCWVRRGEPQHPHSYPQPPPLTVKEAAPMPSPPPQSTVVTFSDDSPMYSEPTVATAAASSNGTTLRRRVGLGPGNQKKRGY